MAKVTRDELKKTLQEAGLENAAPGVVFPWGFKIVELEGEKLLQPLTPDEYAEVVKAETGRSLSKADIARPRCQYVNFKCISQGCNQAKGRCGMHNQYGSWYCLCDY